MRYRERGSIGIIVPPRSNETILEEAFRIRPAGVSWCFSTLGLPEFGQRDFDAALETVERAAIELAERRVSVIAFTGVPLSSSKGVDYADRLRERISTAVGGAIPVETDTRLVTRALRMLGAKRIALVTPYRREVLANVRRQLEGQGFEVASAVGRELRLAQLITDPDFDTAYDAARESFAVTPDIDAFFLSCPQWPVVGAIARLEAATGRPVVTQLQAVVWWAAEVIGLADTVSGFGRLLEHHRPPAARVPGA